MRGDESLQDRKRYQTGLQFLFVPLTRRCHGIVNSDAAIACRSGAYTLAGAMHGAVHGAVQARCSRGAAV